jgi:hypothetical protein
MNEPHQGLPPPPGGGLLLGLPQLLILFPVLTPSDHRPHPHHPAPSLHAQNGVPQEGTEQSTANEEDAQVERPHLRREETRTETSGAGAGMRHGRGGEDAGEPAGKAERWRCHFCCWPVDASNPGTGL